VEKRSNPQNPYFSEDTKNGIVFLKLFHGAASLEGSVGEAIVKLWLYFLSQDSRVEYNIIPITIVIMLLH